MIHKKILNNNKLTMLERISDFENLSMAFAGCSKGKKRSIGYQRLLFANGERLLKLRNDLLCDKYLWQGYKKFIISDPKTRIIMAAPFIDRVVHHAIIRVIEPMIDINIPENVYACRKGKGNRNAALTLLNSLRTIGPNRFSIKLDVKKYFASIDHDILFDKIMSCLPDKSIESLLKGLLKSPPEYALRGKGIPVGNLTSQTFANFYLASADRVALKEFKTGYYFRYMDDSVFVGRDKNEIMDAASSFIEHAENHLKLEIPFYKRVPLGKAPIPFLGYLIDHTGFDVLSRNKRRFSKRIKRLNKQNIKPSYLAQVMQSYNAWCDLENISKSQDLL